MTAKVEILNLPLAREAALAERLIPAVYLDRVAERATPAEQRLSLRALSAQLLAPVRPPEPVLQTLAADLVQRRRSRVEGRHGPWSRHPRGHHRLSDRTLTAFAAVHNDCIQRSDGTAAAERFFGRPPAPLFEQRLERMPMPPSPARRRPPPPKPADLLPIAA